MYSDSVLPRKIMHHSVYDSIILSVCQLKGRAFFCTCLHAAALGAYVSIYMTIYIYIYICMSIYIYICVCICSFFFNSDTQNICLRWRCTWPCLKGLCITVHVWQSYICIHRNIQQTSLLLHWSGCPLIGCLCLNAMHIYIGYMWVSIYIYI